MSRTAECLPMGFAEVLRRLLGWTGDAELPAELRDDLLAAIRLIRRLETAERLVTERTTEMHAAFDRATAAEAAAAEWEDKYGRLLQRQAARPRLKGEKVP